MPEVIKPEGAEAGRQRRNRLLERGLLWASVAAIGLFQYLTPATSTHWLYLIERLYFIPIIVAALDAGWREGIVVSLLAGVAFAMGTPAIWNVPPVEMLDRVLQIGVFCLVGGLAGLMSYRQRKQELTLRKTSAELDRAHRKLQENYEAMKRTERLHALGQLSAGLAHEIRNPLASIEGAAAVMKREGQNEERRQEFLGIIQKESRRLNRMLTSFLDFAKPQAPNLEMVKIDRLFDSVMELARHAGDHRKLELRKDIQRDLVTVQCDEEQMKQVLLNLVMNAIQAMPQGGRVVIAAQKANAGVAIDVQDQGGGIGNGDLDRVFDPFFTTKQTGSGLGLSIAHQIVTQHGGTIRITKNSPQGLTVQVWLPGAPSGSYEKSDTRSG